MENVGMELQVKYLEKMKYEDEVSDAVGSVSFHCRLSTQSSLCAKCKAEHHSYMPDWTTAPGSLCDMYQCNTNYPRRTNMFMP